jgi:hypothetical protein
MKISFVSMCSVYGSPLENKNAVALWNEISRKKNMLKPLVILAVLAQLMKMPRLLKCDVTILIFLSLYSSLIIIIFCEADIIGDS